MDILQRSSLICFSSFSWNCCRPSQVDFTVFISSRYTFISLSNVLISYYMTSGPLVSEYFDDFSTFAQDYYYYCCFTPIQNWFIVICQGLLGQNNNKTFYPSVTPWNDSHKKTRHSHNLL